MLSCLKRGLLTAAIFAAMAFYHSPAEAQQPDRVSVFIGFHEQPGAAEENLVRVAGGQIRYTYSIVPAIAASVPERAIAGLMTNPRVSRVELVTTLRAADHAGSTGSEYEAVWGVEHIGTEPVHSTFNYGAGVTIAVIDSGIACDHPELGVNCVGGEDFVSGGSCTYDPNSSYGSNPFDDNSHGTHVAGTIAALLNGSNIAGVAPKASVVALKVLDGSGNGSFDDVVCALDWVSSYNAQVDPDIRVTNNSYGASGDPGQTVQNAFQNTYNAGVLHIGAAGNNGTGGGFPGGGRFGGGGSDNTMIYPARYSSVIAVAATDESDNRASFSSVGAEMELAAPGSSIYSTVPGGYGTKSGTSMASPHVAGVAALVFSYLGNVTPDTVRNQLVSTADDIGSGGWDKETGYGLVDADEAAADTGDTVTDNPPDNVAVTSPSAGADLTTEPTTVTASASDDSAVAKVTFYANDGSGPVMIGEDTTDPYSTDWSNCAAGDGAYDLTAIAEDDAAQSTVSDPVSVTVSCGTSSEPAPISLTITSDKVKGTKIADLEWSGDGKPYSVTRDGGVIDPEVYGTTFHDEIGKGGGSHTYMVCGSNGGCSDPVTVNY